MIPPLTLFIIKIIFEGMREVFLAQVWGQIPKKGGLEPVEDD